MRRIDVAVLYALTVAGYPVISALPTFAGVDSHLASLIFRVLYFVLAATAIAGNLRRGGLYAGVAWLPFSIFWILYVGRMMWDVVFNPVSLSLSGPDYFVWAFGACLIPMIAFLAAYDDPTLELAASLTMGLCVVASVLALYVSYQALTTGASPTYATGRLETETLNPISLGHLGASTAIMSFIFFRRWTGPRRLVLIGTASLGLFAVIASASRGPLLALSAVVALWLGNRLRSRAWDRLAAYSLGVVTLAGILVWGAMTVQNVFGLHTVDRIVALHDLRGDASAEVHIAGLQGAWQGFVDNPLLGSGLEEERTREYPHNVVVESFMATGIFGGLAFSAIVVISCFAAVNLMRDSGRQWVALLFVQYLVAALVSGALYLSGTFWCFTAAVIALNASAPYADQEAPGTNRRSGFADDASAAENS
jgi:O-antigen ligase